MGLRDFKGYQIVALIDFYINNQHKKDTSVNTNLVYLKFQLPKNDKERCNLKIY